MSQEAKTPSLRIAFVGVGRMGSAMLQCVIDAGYHVTLFDPSEAATAPFAAKHPELVRVARSAREAAQEADVIEIVVNTNEQLTEACLSQDGVFAGARPGSIVLMHSTVAQETLQKLGKAALERGIHLLDAPVAGAKGQLSVGDLAVMVGGEEAQFARAKPVMETYGGLVLLLGPLGAGLDAKLALNMYRYLCMIAGQESAELAERTSPGAGAAIAKLVAHAEANRFIGNGDRRAAFEKYPVRQRQNDAELAQKDLRAAIARAAEVGMKLPSAELAMGLIHRVWFVEPRTHSDQGKAQDGAEQAR
jgi:3-hydroxyisobutyrate dehydrogenase